MPLSSNLDWYSPLSRLDLTAVNYGDGFSPSGSVNFSIGNADKLFSTANSAFREVGGPSFGGYFDWGLPFFYDRSVAVGINKKWSSLGIGPYWAY